MLVSIGMSASNVLAQSDTVILARSQQVLNEMHITADHQGILDSLAALGVLEGREIAAGITNIFQLYDSMQVVTASIEESTGGDTSGGTTGGDTSNGTSNASNAANSSAASTRSSRSGRCGSASAPPASASAP